MYNNLKQRKIDIKCNKRVHFVKVGPLNLLFNEHRGPVPVRRWLGRTLTTDIHLVTRLRISGDKPLLLLYVFLEWIRKTLNLHAD